MTGLPNYIQPIRVSPEASTSTDVTALWDVIHDGVLYRIEERRRLMGVNGASNVYLLEAMVCKRPTLKPRFWETLHVVFYTHNVEPTKSKAFTECLQALRNWKP